MLTSFLVKEFNVSTFLIYSVLKALLKKNKCVIPVGTHINSEGEYREEIGIL